ncbi:MAG TPA: mannosyltransferase [Bacteroidales bacterium]|nr:mannosyltransferase [Bacteroidales bacterium]
MTENLEIHIVSFTIPYPANYGGVIDVYYKIKTLYELSVKIHLHCFQYDREESSELNKYCKTVTYYYRPKRLKYFFSRSPFIVLSRSNKRLLETLQRDQFPILFEGIHTTHFINELVNDSRKIVVRAHNIEHDYYLQLAKKESNIFKKIFFYSEAIKLRNYEKILKSKIKLAGITEKDCAYFKTLNSDTFLIPVFHQHNEINIKSGNGNYILFHGNLSVNENIEAAKYILQNICPKINFQFKFAGKDPDKRLYKLINKTENAEIIANPPEKTMQELIREAHINLLISFQNTGIKLKLINALYSGRHCIVNNEMTDRTGLETLCHNHNSPKKIIQEIKQLLNLSFTHEEINKRGHILLKNVNNKDGAQKLINLLV